MNQERIFKVLKAPHISEKATIVSDQDNQFVFKVAKDATKAEIGRADVVIQVKDSGAQIVAKNADMKTDAGIKSLVS